MGSNLEEMSAFFNQRANIYDNHMLNDLQLAEFYDQIESCFPTALKHMKLLDLGCGTGLELERVFKAHEDAQVTAIDLSEKMLEKLKEKLVNHLSKIKIICGSYFDIDFGIDQFDLALSTYSLHHFETDKKLILYKKIFRSLKKGGYFINGDYTVKTLDEERFYINESQRIRQEQGLHYEFYHYDTPLFFQTEVNLLKESGFSEVTIQKQWDNTSIFVCIK